MLDILLINVPQISLVYPPAGTSLLKGICESQGFSARVRDFNVELYQRCVDNNTKVALDQHFCLNDHASMLPKSVDEFLQNYIEYVIDEIQKENPRWLGISVFTFQCQIFTKRLLRELRSRWAGKIVVGGAGLSTNGISASVADFGSWLLEQDLVDFYIRGEGDKSLIDLLQGQDQGPGINNDDMRQIDDLDALAYPNYDDVIGLPYQWSIGQPQIPVTSSRGCVRKCSFCDIHTAWPKYRFRSGKSVANEFVYHYERYGTTNFWFTDSLINGAMKSFRELCKTLIQYYRDRSLPDRFFRWGGQFIVRNSSSMTAEDYRLAAQAGMNGVAMGVESLSEPVRDHMKKGFTDADLDFTLEQMNANNMNCYFLMIVGYPTETLENHNQAIEKFREYQKYALDGTIYGINLGTTASIDEGTPLYQQMNSDPTQHPIQGFDWISPANPSLDFRERIRRRIEMQEVLMDLGYKIWNADNQLLKLQEAYQKIRDGKYKTAIRLQVSQ